MKIYRAITGATATRQESRAQSLEISEQIFQLTHFEFHDLLSQNKNLSSHPKKTKAISSSSSFRLYSQVK